MSTIRVGPFDLLEPLKSGGMGRVWSAVHRLSGVPVAVKVLTERHARDEDFRAAFRNEVRAQASLDHPHIAMILDHGEVDAQAAADSDGALAPGAPWLAMELVDGGSLSDWRGRLLWEELREVLLALLDALAHAHARGVVHRDIKLANILVDATPADLAPDADGRPWRSLKLTDFGIAHPLEERELARSDDPLGASGTPSYMAPEQIEERWEEYGPWTDLYALGNLAWALTCGSTPFRRPEPEATLLAQLAEPLPRFEPRIAVPAAFESWLARLLEKSPYRRFRRAADAAWALRRLGDPLAAAPPMGLVRITHDEESAGQPTMRAELQTLDWVGAAQLLAEADRRVRSAVPPERVVHERPPIPLSWRRPGRRESVSGLTGASLGLYGLRTIPLVGRVRERDVLWDALLGVHGAGRARHVVVRGPAGSGKSRIAEWLAERAHETGAAIVLSAVHHRRGGHADGLGPMLARHLRCGSMEGRELRAYLARTLPMLSPESVPDVDLLVDLIRPEETSAVRRGERYGALRRLLAGLCAERPVVLVLDDVQWGHDALRFAAWLLHTQRRQPLPVLLVLTAAEDALVERPAEAAALEGLLRRYPTRTLDLAPLETVENRALVEELLGLQGELAARVEERTAGNPLFAVQLVGDWVQRGLLEPGEGGFRLKAGAQADLPDDVHAVWADRVERLLEARGEQDRTALELAAVLGQDVDRAEWEAVCRAVGIPVPWDLVERMLEQRLARAGEGGLRDGWEFAHGMLRESLERMAAEAGRLPGHHTACAGMLADRAGPRTAQRIGRHLLAAGQVEAALEPLYRGITACLDRDDWTTALALIAERERALAAAGWAGDDPRRAPHRIQHAIALWAQGELERAGRLAEELLSDVERADWEEVRVPTLRLVARYRGMHGDQESNRTLLLRARDLAVTRGDDHGAACCAFDLGLLSQARGRHQEAHDLLLEAERHFQRSGSLRGIGGCWRALGALAVDRNQLEEAEAYLARADEVFRQQGSREGLAATATTCALVAREQGDPYGAEQYLREAMDHLEATASPRVLAVRLALAGTLLRMGRLEEARELAGSELEALNRLGHRPMLAATHSCLLACHAADPSGEAWARHLEALDALLAGQPLLDLDTARALQLAATLANEAGHRDRAEAAAKRARRQLEGLGRAE